MVKIQISLNEEENKIVEIYKAIKKHKTKQETIKAILREFKPKLRI